MNPQAIFNSRRAGEWALRLCRKLPPSPGYRLADFIAARLASRKRMPLVDAIRSNQWGISQGKLSSQELDLAVKEVLTHAARSNYNMFHYLGDDAFMRDYIVWDSTLERLVEMSHKRERGVIVGGIHMCYFDFATLCVLKHGLRAFALTLAQATPAIEWQHDLRRQSGMEIVPATMANLRQTIKRLQNGEIVVTGIDRPLAEVKCRPRFLGRPSHAPVHYIQLALKAQVPVVVLAAVMQPDGRCKVLSSDFIEMQPHPDRNLEITQNAERVLDIAASFIAQSPQQWGVFWPVWPELSSDIA